MAIQLEDVRAALEPEEPDYQEAAKLGAEALPHLQTLIESGDSQMASKAASLAGFIDDPAAEDVLLIAAASEDPIVRVAAAGAAQNLAPERASSVLLELVDDQDLGVQLRAYKSVPQGATPKLMAKVENMATQPQFLTITPEALAPEAAEMEAEEAYHIPELSPMPSYEGEVPSYDQGISADEMTESGGMPEMERDMPRPPGEAYGGTSGDQEMLGQQPAVAEGSMIEDDQLMPGEVPTSGAGGMGGDEQEMPEV
jgi:hypothetical protein